MARTFPSVGLSPCDFYVEDEARPCAYFEHVITLTAATRRGVRAYSTVTFIANSRYSTIEAWLKPVGTTGTWGTAILGVLDQDDVKGISGYMTAGYFILKNSADACCNAAVVRLECDNDSNVGFGGVMHSFIECVDNSSGTKLNNLFALYTADATTAASATELTCVFGNSNAISHVIKISIGGVPYWILLDSTPPA